MTLCNGMGSCDGLFIFQADELAPVGNYNQRKQEEERRIQDILDRLNTLCLELSPPGPSTTAGSVPVMLCLGAFYDCVFFHFFWTVAEND